MKILIALASFMLFTSCAHEVHKSGDNVEQNMTIGANLNANRYSNLYFSSQPQENDYKELKAQGFETIINLRAAGEYDEKTENTRVQSNKMNYLNIPFPAKQELTDDYITKVTEAVKVNRKNGKILIHCASGNRVGLWLGGHFFKDHKYGKKESIAMAQKLGLNHDKALMKLNRYLDKK